VAVSRVRSCGSCRSARLRGPTVLHGCCIVMIAPHSSSPEPISLSDESYRARLSCLESPASSEPRRIARAVGVGPAPASSALHDSVFIGIGCPRTNTQGSPHPAAFGPAQQRRGGDVRVIASNGMVRHGMIARGRAAGNQTHRHNRRAVFLSARTTASRSQILPRAVFTR